MRNPPWPRFVSSEEKARRKALRDTYKRVERKAAMTSLTLDRPALDSLLDHLDERSRQQGCDHTLRFTQAWAQQEGRVWETLADALREAGGYCDCEVLANAGP